MINNLTVLVLGAGASVPFGYPSGRALFEEIYTKLGISFGLFQELRAAGYDKDQIMNFRDSLKRSGKSSVDAFLEHRPEFISVGKAAITSILTSYEVEDKLFNKQDWYHYLYDKLNTSFDDFDKNKIAVITYNYDHSLEHFLFTALQNSYGKTDKECADKLKEIPIIHVHGKLGNLHWQDSSGSAYGRSGGIDNLKTRSGSIKIIHEDIANDPEFQQAHQLLNKAQKIYFIGFGYDKTNIERLVKIDPSTKLVLGSAYGMTDREREEAQGILISKGAHTANVVSGHLDAHSFVRSHIDWS